MQQGGGSEQPVKGRRVSRPKARTSATPSIADLQEQVGVLTRELKEALERQTATADILKVISRSALNLQKVFDALTESACRVCGAYDAVLHLREAEFLYTRSHHGPIPIDWDKMIRCAYRGTLSLAAQSRIGSLYMSMTCRPK